MRVQTIKKFAWKSKEYKLLKYNWKLSLKRHNELEHTKPSYNRHLKDNLTQEQIVEDGLDINKVFNNAYNLVQDFLEAMDIKDITKMESVINSTDEVGSQLAVTLKTFKEKYEDCFEGANRKIK